MEDELDKKRRAFLLAQLLCAPDRKLARGSANKQIPARTRKALQLSARAANELRDVLASEKLIITACSSRSQTYQLTKDGYMALLNLLPHIPNLENANVQRHLRQAESEHGVGYADVVHARLAGSPSRSDPAESKPTVPPVGASPSTASPSSESESERRFREHFPDLDPDLLLRIDCINSSASLVVALRRDGPLPDCAPSSEKEKPRPLDRRHQELLWRYTGAALFYLLRILKDRDTAEELSQEFATRLVKGDYTRNYSREKGRFRDYLKSCLRNLAHDYLREKCKSREIHDSDLLKEQAARTFDSTLTIEILERARRRLAFGDGPGFQDSIVLELHEKNREASSAELASLLSERLGARLDDRAARQRLHRARQRFADQIVAEVSETCDCVEYEDLKEELRQLGLLKDCKQALMRHTVANTKLSEPKSGERPWSTAGNRYGPS